MQAYSSEKVSRTLLAEIKNSLASLEGWGSVELFVQDGTVTQITVRKIKKTLSNIKGKNTRRS